MRDHAGDPTALGQCRGQYRMDVRFGEVAVTTPTRAWSPGAACLLVELLQKSKHHDAYFFLLIRQGLRDGRHTC